MEFNLFSCFLGEDCNCYFHKLVLENEVVEIEWDGTNWIDLAQDRDWRKALVNIVKKLQISSKILKHLSY
jgi:hypothetical protein